MSDDFKRYFNNNAKSKAEIEDEVMRLIRSRIREVTTQAVSEVIEEGSAGRGEKIPPREQTLQQRHENVSYIKKPQQIQMLLEDDIAAPPSDDLNAWLDNDIAEKIQQMRTLGQVIYKGSMRRECAEITIVKQGEFMKDVTDDYGRSSFCNIERPLYGAMSTSQLRTYFSWRTLVRRGVWESTDQPYVMLYCYEIMNKIGISSSQEIFEHLIEVWNNCRGFCSVLDRYMPMWLRDFYAFNNIAGEFSEYESRFPIGSGEMDVQSRKLLSRDYSGCLQYFIQYSSYNLKGSKFYSKETIPMLEGALELALKRVDKFFSERKISLFELICGRMRKDYGWRSFSNAYVDIDRLDGFRTCSISAMERYCVKLGEPSHELFELAPYRGLIGYILKSVECGLRKATGFRASVQPNISMALDELKNREKIYAAVSEPEFSDIAIRSALAWASMNGIQLIFDKKKSNIPRNTAEPVKVEIDVTKLQQIREQSDELTRRLIIEDAEDTPPVEEILQMAESIEDDAFDERTDEAAFEIHSQYDFSSLAEGWRQLAQALDAHLLELLCAVARGAADSLCRDKGILPEIAFEQINDIALDNIGDVLIENGSIISDYAQDVAQIMDIIS